MEWQSLKSSNLEACSYDEATRELHVRFQGGGQYVYRNVPRDKYERLLTAESAGQYLNQSVKGHHEFEKAK